MIFWNIPLDRRMYTRYNPSRFTKPFSILFAIIVGAVVQVKKIFRKHWLSVGTSYAVTIEANDAKVKPCTCNHLTEDRRLQATRCRL